MNQLSNLDAERGVLGAALLDADKVMPFAVNRKKLLPDAFHHPPHALLWKTLMIMFSEKRPIDVLTVSEKLGQVGLNKIGGIAYLNDLLDSIPTASHAEYYMDILLSRHTTRKVALLSIELESANKSGDLDECTRINDLIKVELENHASTKQSFEVLPTIIDAAVLTATPMAEPPQVIAGVLHRGSKAVYGGPSKAFKTWTLLDMCLAVATGTDWLGFNTDPGPVLYMNFELQPFAVHKRLLVLAEIRGCEVPHNLHIWNLRGYSRPLSQLLPELLRQIKGEGYALIIPDPIYKTLSGKNENDAGDIGTVCGEIESVAVQTGAAVAFGAHFAKGNASGKEHIDRVSGSGVWARDPDSIITATTHEMEGCFSVEMTLRNFPQPKPFVIRWEYPQMRREDMLDPKDLKQQQMGRKPEHDVDDIMPLLTSNGLTTGDWQKAVMAETGMCRSLFYRLRNDAETQGIVAKSRDGIWQKVHNVHEVH